MFSYLLDALMCLFGPSRILTFLKVGVHGLALYRFTVRDTENDWFVDGLKNPDLYLTVGETTIFEFTFSGYEAKFQFEVRFLESCQFTYKL